MAEPRDAQDVIARASDQYMRNIGRSTEDAIPDEYADAILAALAEAGYVVVKADELATHAAAVTNAFDALLGELVKETPSKSTEND